MLLRWKGVYYLCATILILLAYIDASTGQSTTAAAENTTEPVIILATVTPLPPLDAPGNVAVEEVAGNNTAFTVTWDHDPDPRTDVAYYINVVASDGSEPAENVTDATSGEIITGKTPGKEYDITVVAVDNENGDIAGSVPRTLRLSPNMVVNLRRKNSSSTTVQAEWVKPSGEVSGYRVSCSDGVPDEDDITDENKTEASCSGNGIAGKEVTMTVITVSVDKESVPKNVTIRANPNPVENLTESSADTSSVTAAWSAPSSGEVDGYKVDCSSGTETAVVDKGGGQYEASCTGIEAGKTITVTVSSVSGTVESIPKSIPITAYPSAVVLTESDATTDSVTVSWTQPSGTFDSYEGSCSDGSLSGTLNKASTSATCTGVTPGNVVTVTVNTTSGDKESSDDLDVTAIPNAVVLMEADATTSSVTVRWTGPGGIFDSYDVSCSDGALDGTLDADSIEATCTGVTGGNLVTVTVYTISGKKNNSDSENVRALPYSVVNLTEVDATMTTIQASWEFPGGFVSKYQVSCSDGIANPPEVPENSSTEYTSICEGLQTPGDTYTMTVTSVSGTKHGSAETVQITAIPASPNLQGLPSTVENVSVSWSHPNGIVDSFEVKCDPESISRPVEGSIDAGGSTTFEAACEVDRPGELFNLSVISVSGDKKSSVSVESLRALPESVDTFMVATYSSNDVTLSWTMTDKCENGGCVWTSFEITWNSNQTDDITDTDRRISRIDSLTPGEEYTFDIFVISYDEFSTSKSTTQRLRPDNVGELRVPSNDSYQITVEWDKPKGTVSGYDTTITGTGYSDTRHVTDPEVTVTYDGLIPGEYYDVTVCTRSDEEFCTEVSRKSRIRTIPILPTAPVEVSLRALRISSVELTFKEPDEPNGIIMKYIISYTGTKNGDSNEDSDVTEIEASGQTEFTETFTGLWPGFTYVFTVSAVNEAGPGDEASDDIVLEQEKPVDSTVPPVEVAITIGTDIRTFSVQFSSGLFSHCNGELKTYSVFVVQDRGNETISDPPRSYEDAQKQKTLPAYLAIAEEPYPFAPDYSSCENQRKKRQTESTETVVIGDGTCKEISGKEYCNGELHGNRDYKVKFRACNDVGCSETPFSIIIATELNNLSWGLPLLFIIIILLCALVLFMVWKERKQPGSITRYINKRSKSGVDNRGFEHDKPMRRQGDNRPVKLAEFGQFLEDMSRDSDYLFSEEYNDLRPIGKNQSTDAAQLEVNRVKNRFSNILPYDHTRVSLSPIDDEEGSDYINANYMLGYRSQREYIACQGPLQSTEEDMWRLVWEQGSSIIVMVTQLMENGKIKCHQYWPDEGEGPVRYGEIVVNPGKVKKEQLWTVRKFQLTKGPVTRTITHFNFIAWPDHGVPERPDDLIKFVQAVRDCKKNDGKPTVVHCSAGVGRTGTFISLDHLMSAMKEKDEVDIYGMVRKMRMNRCMMVQTESQYIFIHQCVMAILEGPDESDAVYENVNGNGYYSEALI